MNLIKQQFVMHQHVFDLETGLIAFVEHSDEPGVCRGFGMTKDDWMDMNNPKVITVTIEPGDTLNHDT